MKIKITVTLLVLVLLVYMTLDRPWNVVMDKWQKYVIGFDYEIVKDFGAPPSYFYTGQLKWYHADTSIDSEVDIKNGQLHGFWTRYENGKIWWKGHYDNGYLVEEWRLEDNVLTYDNTHHFTDMVFDRGNFRVFSISLTHE